MGTEPGSQGEPTRRQVPAGTALTTAGGAAVAAGRRGVVPTESAGTWPGGDWWSTPNTAGCAWHAVAVHEERPAVRWRLWLCAVVALVLGAAGMTATAAGGWGSGLVLCGCAALLLRLVYVRL